MIAEEVERELDRAAPMLRGVAKGFRDTGHDAEARIVEAVVESDTVEEMAAGVHTHADYLDDRQIAQTIYGLDFVVEKSEQTDVNGAAIVAVIAYLQDRFIDTEEPLELFAA